MAYNIRRVDQRKHSPRVTIDHESAVELVRSPRRLLNGHRRIRLAEGRRRLQAAQILPAVEGSGDVAGRIGLADSRCQNRGGKGE